jgi:hypothetical protein
MITSMSPMRGGGGRYRCANTSPHINCSFEDLRTEHVLKSDTDWTLRNPHCTRCIAVVRLAWLHGELELAWLGGLDLASPRTNDVARLMTLPSNDVARPRTVQDKDSPVA